MSLFNMISYPPCHHHHGNTMIRMPYMTITLVFMVLCIISLVSSSSSFTFGTNNTFIEGSRTTFSFKIDQVYQINDSEVFSISASSMDTINAPVGFYVEDYGTMGHLSTWPIFTNTTLWGHYPDQREVTCWANDDKTIPVGRIEYPSDISSIADVVGDLSQLPPLSITFRSTYNTIPKDSTITCYIQSIVGTYINQLDIYRQNTNEHITVKVEPDTQTKITFQQATKGKQYPIVDLPFTMSNAMPYGAYVYQFGVFLDYHRPAATTVVSVSTPTTTTTATTLSHDEKMLLSENVLSGEYDTPTKMFLAEPTRSVGPWSYYDSWTCTDNLARIYVLSSPTPTTDDHISHDAPYGNIRYVILTAQQVTQHDVIKCKFPAHVDDIAKFEPIVAHPERFDEILSYYLSPQHEKPEKHKIIHAYTPYMRIGRIDTHTTPLISQYFNTKDLSDFMMTYSRIIRCEPEDDIEPENPDDPFTTRITCSLDGPHRLAKLELLDPSSYRKDSKSPVYNFAKHSVAFTATDFNQCIHDLSHGVTFKDGIFYFDNSDWNPSPDDGPQEQTFSFSFTSTKGHKFHNKFIMPLARLYFTIYTINEDGSSDLTKEGQLEGLPLFTFVPSFNRAAEYNISPNDITLTARVHITSNYISTSQKDIPIGISPYTQDTMASLDRALVSIDAQKAIKCVAEIGAGQKIIMSYSLGLDLPIWTGSLPSDVLSSEEKSTIKIVCTMKTDMIITNFKPHSTIYFTISDTLFNIGTSVVYDPKEINRAIYRPIAIVRNIIVQHPITPLKALEAYQWNISHIEGISRQCRGILGNLSVDQIAITDIEYIDNSNIVSYIPGTHAGSIFGTQGRVTMLVKEGLTVFDNLPAGCSPHTYEDMTIYGSKYEAEYPRNAWYDKKLILKPNLYYPQTATGQKCTNGYQCIDPTASCRGGICRTMLYPDSSLFKGDYEPSFVSFLL